MRRAHKGARAEKEWKRILERKGYLVTRCPRSGFAQSACYDLHATDRSGRSSLWEVKSTKGQVKYFSPKELLRLRELLDLAKAHNMTCFVAVRFPGLTGLYEIAEVPEVLQRKKLRLREGFG